MANRLATAKSVGHYRAGELVDVLSYPEILRTLDAAGCVDNLPFMSEMEPFCGKTFRVARRADRVCVEGASAMGYMPHAVFLEELRCDGQAHGGCKRGCLLIWKEVWLRPSESSEPITGPPIVNPLRHDDPDGPVAINQPYFCQSTQLRKATTHLPWWSPAQYVRDVFSGNLTWMQLFRTLTNFLYRKTIGAALAKLDARLHPRVGKTPVVALSLQPGDLVQVRDYRDIVKTLDARGCNRGLEFSAGMSDFCGQRYRVLQRLDRMIVERDGKMREISNTVILDNVACTGMCARGCPRRNYIYWREAWLERAS